MPKSALSQHEELCEQRYGEINRRLDRIEGTIDNIERSIDGFKNQFIQISLKVGIGALVALFSAVYVVKFH